MEQVWDPHGEAAAALARAVEGYGPQVLGRADLLAGLLEDDVPHLPREVALLTAAAKSRASEVIAERIGHGLPPDQAVAMAGAEIAARTAMDASGSRWAAGQYARVLGHQVRADGSTPATPTVAAGTAAGTAEPPATPTVAAGTTDGAAGTSPAASARQALDQPTALPDGAKGRPADQPPPATGTVPRKLAVAAAVACAVAAPMPLAWGLLPWSEGAGGVVFAFWLDTALLTAGLSFAAAWAARRSRTAAGLAAVLGLAVPLTGLVVYRAATAQLFLSDSAFSGTTRHLLVAATWVWLVAATAAAGVAAAGLVRAKQLGRPKAGLLAIATSAAAVAFAFAFVIKQEDFSAFLAVLSTVFPSIFGSGVQGWRILWGVVFLALACLPPVFGLLLRSPGLRVAMWSGWLVFGLAWQLTYLPLSGATAKAGAYLTWVLWVAVLLCTALMAARARAQATP